MKINLLVFGLLADITEKTELKISDVENTDALKQKLEDAFPSLHAVKYNLAINKKITQGNAILKDEDTVALLPPFSGG